MSKGTLPTKSRFFYSTTFNEYLQDNPNPLFFKFIPYHPTNFIKFENTNLINPHAFGTKYKRDGGSYKPLTLKFIYFTFFF